MILLLRTVICVFQGDSAPSQDASSLGWFICCLLSCVCQGLSPFSSTPHLWAGPSHTNCHLCLPRCLTFQRTQSLSFLGCSLYMCVNVCIYKFLDILLEFVGSQASCVYCHPPLYVCVNYNHLSVCFESYPTG